MLGGLQAGVAEAARSGVEVKGSADAARLEIKVEAVRLEIDVNNPTEAAVSRLHGDGPAELGVAGDSPAYHTKMDNLP